MITDQNSWNSRNDFTTGSSDLKKPADQILNRSVFGEVNLHLGYSFHDEVKLRISSEHQGRKFTGSHDDCAADGWGGGPAREPQHVLVTNPSTSQWKHVS